MIKVTVDRVADLAKAAPTIRDEMETDPPRPGMSRLRCFFFFKYGDLSELCYARSRMWWMENLQELCYEMDKEYSRAASRRAIPQLMNEINFLRDPKQAEERLRLLAFGWDNSWARGSYRFLLIIFRHFSTLIACLVAVVIAIFWYQFL